MNRVADFGTLKNLWTSFLDGNSRDLAPRRSLSTNGPIYGRRHKPRS
jgi:hypothetical protein